MRTATSGSRQRRPSLWPHCLTAATPRTRPITGRSHPPTCDPAKCRSRRPATTASTSSSRRSRSHNAPLAAAEGARGVERRTRAMTGFYQKTGLGPAMYNYVTGLDWKDYLGGYFGNELKPLNAAHNRMMGETRQGDRIVFYWDAAEDWMGWSFMFDRVTDIGAVADGWLVRPPR